jgi:hypothetical protein
VIVSRRSSATWASASRSGFIGGSVDGPFTVDTSPAGV